MSEDAHDIRVKIIYSGSYINDLGIVNVGYWRMKVKQIDTFDVIVLVILAVAWSCIVVLLMYEIVEGLSCG